MFENEVSNPSLSQDSLGSSIIGRLKKHTLLIVAIIAILLLLFMPAQLQFQFSLPGSKVDDWQFNSQPMRPEDYNFISQLQYLGRITWSGYANLSLFIKLQIVAGIALLSIFPIGAYQINYRFLNWVISKFKKNYSYTISRTKVREFLTLFIGLLGWFGAMVVYIITTSSFSMVNTILNLTFVSYFVITLFSLLSFIIFCCAAVLKKLTHSNWNLHQWGLNAASNILSVVYFLLIYAVIQFLMYIFGFSSISSALSTTSSIKTPGAISPGRGFSAAPSFGALPMSGGGMADSSNIGFSVGGAKDINNFRENIKNNYFPLTSDITYEGLFYDYYFDTSGEAAPCTSLFCPSYSYASSNDPISNHQEYYLSVGLNSNIQEQDFKRKKLNLVVVMDISGSMSSSFDEYYYDQVGGEEVEREYTSKMKVANESLVALVDHLQPDDRLGVVLFDDVSYLAKPINLVGATDMEAIKSHILEISEQGGTNMEAGYEEGTRLLEEYQNVNKDEYENRIIFLTDAQPNTGQLEEEGLFGMSQVNADKGIFTTFIGVGVDFNTELIEAMTKVKGANYYSVHSSEDFMKRMDEGFEYMVTPLVFDLKLQFLSDDFEIEKVYGSPEADEATGQIMHVNTLFPSDSEGGEVKGGVVLLKLKPKNGASGVAQLKASYTTRSGQAEENQVTVNVGSTTTEFYGSTGIQKAIALTRYVNLIKIWIEDERKAQESNSSVTPRITTETGIIIPAEQAGTQSLSPWERQSVPLKVSLEYGALFADFEDYFDIESAILRDPTMDKELEVLDTLIKKSGYLSGSPSALSPLTAPIDELTYEEAQRLRLIR